MVGGGAVRPPDKVPSAFEQVVFSSFNKELQQFLPINQAV